MDDLLFDPPEGPRPGSAQARKCRRHEWSVVIKWSEDPDRADSYQKNWGPCVRCGQPYSEAAARRGRTNRQRGNAIEREVAKSLGLRRVGQYGGPEDVSGEMFVAQVKSGGVFSERYWAWLQALPRNAGQTPLLVVTDAPGPGHKRRAVVVLDLSDWIALHGPVTEDAA